MRIPPVRGLTDYCEYYNRERRLCKEGNALRRREKNHPCPPRKFRFACRQSAVGGGFPFTIFAVFGSKSNRFVKISEKDTGKCSTGL